MRFNPLRLQEIDGQSDFVLLRIDRACNTSAFVGTLWSWWPISVHLSLFLTTADGARLSLTCAVLCLDAPEVALGVTERRECISVDCWEVPSPPVASWSPGSTWANGGWATTSQYPGISSTQTDPYRFFCFMKNNEDTWTPFLSTTSAVRPSTFFQTLRQCMDIFLLPTTYGEICLKQFLALPFFCRDNFNQNSQKTMVCC